MRTTFGALLLGAVSLWFVHAAVAQEWAEPSGQPPSGNPPGFVWTRSPAGAAQAGGQFNVAGPGKVGGILEALGGVVFGSGALDLGAGDGGENIIYSSANRSTMHPDDALLLLQTTESGAPGAEVTDRVRVDRDGTLAVSGDVAGSVLRGRDQLCIGASCRASWPSLNVTPGANISLEAGAGGAQRINVVNDPTFTGTVSVGGDLQVTGCTGSVFRSVSSSAVTGDLGGAPNGYIGANARCSAAVPGSHLCSVDEVLESIRCGAFTRPGVNLGLGSFWVAAGPPGFTANANDCSGWTTLAANELGPYWLFNATTGGKGYLTPCNISYEIGCCR